MFEISPDQSFSQSNNGFISQPGSLNELHLLNNSQEELDQSFSSPPNRGWINEHFSLIVLGSKKMRMCLAEGCNKHYAAGSSTRVFKDHWHREHSTAASSRKTRFMFHDHLHINRLIKMVLARHLDYNLVDQPEFKKFVESLNPNKHIICRQTLAGLVNKSKLRLMNLVCEKLESAVSVALTFDIWSVRKGARGFGCVTAHYISSMGSLENLILHFKRMRFPHDSDTIKQFIEKPITQYKLQGRVAAITTDNASNNIAAIRMIDKSMGLTSLDLGFIHYKCVAHIFDLGMKDAMKDLKEMLKPVRDAVMAIRSSRKRKEKFLEKQGELILEDRQATKQPLELAEDVDHRWNSAFVLLERAHSLREAIDFMIETTKGLESIPSIDWRSIHQVILFLRPFNEATKRLCSATDVTISVVSYITPRLIDHCSKCESNDNEWIAAAARSLKSKLSDYELHLYHPIVDVAYLLDPRCKTKNMSDEHRTIVLERVRKLLDEMPQPSIDPLISVENSILGCDSDTEEQMDELSTYCDGRRAKMKTDVIMWWKNNTESFPKLATIARKILSIQGTSVASERVFSVAGDVDTKSRNRLSDESVEDIVLFKSWMQFLNIE